MASTSFARPFSLFDPHTPSPSSSASSYKSPGRPHYLRQSQILAQSRPSTVYYAPSSSPLLPRSVTPPPELTKRISISALASMGVRDVLRHRKMSSNNKMRPPEPPFRGPLAVVDNIDDKLHSPKRSTVADDVRPERPPKVKRQRSMPLLGLGKSISKASRNAESSKYADLPSSFEEESNLSGDEQDTPDVQRGTFFEEKKYLTTRGGMKHHPYSTEDAPYMQAYDDILLDNDRFTDSLLRRVNPTGTPSFCEEIKVSPSNVLDLGCGQGRWVLEAALAWKSCGTKVTGFDLVNVESTSWNIDKHVLDNISWVRGNFVKYPLPFSDNSFDFVRMANLSLCIPYDRWRFVLGEVFRVLSPQGRLELIDDHIFFPYEKSIPKHAPTPSKLTPFRPKPASLFDMDSDNEDEDDKDSKDASSPIDDNESQDVHDKLQEFSVGPDFSAEWDARSETCKGLETMFERMLWQKYGIHPRPHEFIERFLEEVFGASNYLQTHNKRVALAPREYSCTTGNNHSDSDSASLRSTDTSGQKSTSSKEDKKWISIEWDKKDRKEKIKSERTSGDSFASQSQLHMPETISAKAAGRLGIMPPSRPAFSQSPGLIILPSTFLPMPPAELEMHACKNVHVLLGCRAALADFLAEFLDENGERMVCDTEIDDTMWEYECFRRKRFSWPADIPSLHMDDNTGDSAPKSATFRLSSSFDVPSAPSFFGRPRSGSGSNGSSPISSNKSLLEDVTTVRALRVYEAYKMEPSPSP